MSASHEPRRTPRLTTVTALTIAFALASASAPAALQPAEAIERARTLERDGHTTEAEYYLRELVATDDNLSRSAAVLLELARLTPSADESLSLIERALSRTRDGELVAGAMELQGDYLYASGRYVEAAATYEEASHHAPRERANWILLKRASSLLALGDASAAAEAYRGLATGGGMPSDVTPWATLGLGQALLVAGDAEDAAEEFMRVAEGYPRHDVRPRALFGAAQAHRVAGDVPAARDALEALLAEYADTFEAVLAREDLQALGSEFGALEPDTTFVAPAAGQAAPGVDEAPE